MRDESTFGELEIDETFAVRGVEIVKSGTATAGRIYPNPQLFLGPFTDCTFKDILVQIWRDVLCRTALYRDEGGFGEFRE